MRGGSHAALGGAAAIPLAMLAVPWPAVAVENHRTGMTIPGRRWVCGRVVWHRHVLADMANPSPQMLWWPFSRRMVRPRWPLAVREASLAGCWVERVVVVMSLAP